MRRAHLSENRLIPNYAIGLIIIHMGILVGCSSDSDGNQPSETKDQITVTTSNLNVDFDENPEQGALIGIISGQTNSGSVKFTLKDQQPTGALIVNAETGEITVADPTLFDFEEHPEITGTVAVTNGGVSKNAVITISLNDLFEEKVYRGDKQFYSQSDLNDFGAEMYTKIEGNLTIEEFLGPTDDYFLDLTPLSTISAIGGKLTIRGTEKLQSLDGLEVHNVREIEIRNNLELLDISSLETIKKLEGALWVMDNPILNSLEGLHNMTDVSELWVSANNSLNDLSGLDGLENVTGTVAITENNAIKSLSGLENLKSLGAGTSSSSLWIASNPNLENIEALSSLNDFSGDLHIIRNNSLLEIIGLKSSAYRYIEFLSNPSLQSLSGLSNLKNVQGWLSITDNGELKGLEGLENLNSVDELIIVQNPKMSDFCAITALIETGQPNTYNVTGNFYNPTSSQILGGDCNK